MNPAREQLAAALRAKQPWVRVERCGETADGLMAGVLNDDPRLLAFLNGYQVTLTGFGPWQTCEFTIQYRGDAPASVDEVEVLGPDWSPERLFGPDRPRNVTLITADETLLRRHLDRGMTLLQSTYEGCLGWQISAAQFPQIPAWKVCRVTYAFVGRPADRKRWENEATAAVQDVWRRLLGTAAVPQLVKVFLAYSYFAQTGVYDHDANRTAQAAPGQPPADPVPHLAYGPLVQGRGVCSGFSWAFKRMMDAAGIPCRCICGRRREESRTGHMWVMVKLDGMWYHLDPTYTVQNQRTVFTGAFLRPDSAMRATHEWNESLYPAARGTRFDYESVRELLDRYGETYAAAGADRRFLFPQAAE